MTSSLSASLASLSSSVSASISSAFSTSLPSSQFISINEIYDVAKGILSTFQFQVGTGNVYSKAIQELDVLRRQRIQETSGNFVIVLIQTFQNDAVASIIRAHEEQEKLAAQRIPDQSPADPEKVTDSTVSKVFSPEEGLQDRIQNEVWPFEEGLSEYVTKVKNAKVKDLKPGKIYLSKETKKEDVLEQLHLFKLYSEKLKKTDHNDKTGKSDKKFRSISQPIVMSSSLPTAKQLTITTNNSSSPSSSTSKSTFETTPSPSSPVSLIASTNSEKFPLPPSPPLRPLPTSSSAVPPPPPSRKPSSPLPPFHRPGALSMSGTPGLPPLSPVRPNSPGTFNAPKRATSPPHLRQLTEGNFFNSSSFPVNDERGPPPPYQLNPSNVVSSRLIESPARRRTPTPPPVRAASPQRIARAASNALPFASPSSVPMAPMAPILENNSVPLAPMAPILENNNEVETPPQRSVSLQNQRPVTESQTASASLSSSSSSLPSFDVSGLLSSIIQRTGSSRSISQAPSPANTNPSPETWDD